MVHGGLQVDDLPVSDSGESGGGVVAAEVEEQDVPYGQQAGGDRSRVRAAPCSRETVGEYDGAGPGAGAAEQHRVDSTPSGW